MLGNNIFWIIRCIIATVIEWTVFGFLIDGISERKRSKTLLNISVLLSVCISVFIKNISRDININLATYILIGLIIYSINYRTQKLECIFISLLYWVMAVGLDIAGTGIVVFINDIRDMSVLNTDIFYNLEIMVISKPFLILLSPIVKTLKIDISIRKKDFLLLSIPIVANVAGITFIFGYILKDRNINSLDQIFTLTISTAFLFSNVALMGIIARIMKEEKIRIEYEIIKEKINAQHKYYLSMKESQDKIKRLYHDMNNHIMCIQNIYGENEQANRYIRDIKKKIEDCRYTIDSGNMILDVILKEKKDICDKNNIDIIIDINFSNCDFIDSADVCSIFSNMLDNAIEACMKIDYKDKKRKIVLRGTIVKKMFVIRCENTKVNNIKSIGGRLVTDKKDSFVHGIGIHSIKSSVENYYGNVEIISDEDIFKMLIYIPLC